MRYFLAYLVATLLVNHAIASGATVASEEHSNAQQRDTTHPNILLIVVDDMGYNDLGAYGNEAAPTPTLNQLASEGTRFTRHYAHASCSVSRTALLTGNYPAHNSFRPAAFALSPGTPTIASVLKSAGYRTHHVGKWHVGNATKIYEPDRYGFDSWFGFLLAKELKGLSDDGIHFKGITYTDPWLRSDDAPPKQYKGHLTDIFADGAIEFLQSQQASSQPWFLNLWFFAPHKPIDAAQEYRQRHPSTGQGRYYALLEQLDSNIGRVLQALDDTGARDNTLVILLSDNGGTNELTDNNYPFHGKKTQFREGGLRTPLLIRWPGRMQPAAVSKELVSSYDIMPTIAAAAGAALPEEAIGRNLLAQDLPSSPQLFWEYSNSYIHSYSVLSRDGRWRFSQGSYLEPILYDLESDPGEQLNLVEKYPQIVSELHQDYLAWRLAQREPDVDYQPLAGNGARLLGDDLQRSPGYGGFTFAIGATPDMNEQEGDQTIVEQTGRWHLQHSPTRGLNLDILGHKLNGPSLQPGKCSNIVVTSHFHYSPLKPKKNKGIIELYIDGKRVAHQEFTRPELHDEDYDNATYIGTNASGEAQFRGELSHPVLLNERVVLDYVSGLIDNGISAVPDTCNQEAP